MRRISSNVGGIHEHCAKERKSTFQKLHTISEVKKGDFIKSGIKGRKPNGGQVTEHIWFEVTRNFEGVVTAKLANDPVYNIGMVIGQEKKFKFEEISDLLKKEDMRGS